MKVVVTEEKLAKGDYINIHFEDGLWKNCYALCRYDGMKNGHHIFISETYGWKYVVDVETGVVVNTYNPEKIMKVNNETNWMRFLP